MEDEPRQLKVRGGDVKEKGEKKEIKEKQEKGGKWVVVLILGVTVLASLIFKLVNKQEEVRQEIETPKAKEKPSFQLFKPTVYEFGQ